MGESLTATLKVYARVNLVDVQGKKIPPFDGFLTEDVKIPQIHLEREDITGKYMIGWACYKKRFFSRNMPGR